MTVRQLLGRGISSLEDGGIENAASEAMWLLEAALEKGREYILLNSSDTVLSEKEQRYLDFVGERLGGRPIQYILGKWDFYGNEFFVGEGVLIPRPETELLVDFAREQMKNGERKTVFDLCAGSGCIGLSVARLFPDSRVCLIEKSSEAFEYLKKNKEKLNCGNAEIINGDIFDGPEALGLPKPDLILSNPPYIESKLLPELQAEVRREPALALDGGEDGLDFYRAIAARWLSGCLGSVAVECAEGQATEIQKLFSEHFALTETVCDFGGIQRVVTGKERK